jgi:hypothetical protein
MKASPTTDIIAAGQKAFGEYLTAQRAFRARGELLIKASRGLLCARERFKCNRDFSKWLNQSVYATISKHDRSCMLQIARNADEVAAFLKQHPSLGAPVLIWRMVRMKRAKANGRKAHDDDQRANASSAISRAGPVPL